MDVMLSFDVTKSLEHALAQSGPERGGLSTVKSASFATQKSKIRSEHPRADSSNRIQPDNVGTTEP